MAVSSHQGVATQYNINMSKTPVPACVDKFTITKLPSIRYTIKGYYGLVGCHMMNRLYFFCFHSLFQGYIPAPPRRLREGMGWGHYGR